MLQRQTYDGEGTSAFRFKKQSERLGPARTWRDFREKRDPSSLCVATKAQRPSWARNLTETKLQIWRIRGWRVGKWPGWQTTNCSTWYESSQWWKLDEVVHPSWSANCRRVERWGSTFITEKARRGSGDWLPIARYARRSSRADPVASWKWCRFNILMKTLAGSGNLGSTSIIFWRKEEIAGGNERIVSFCVVEVVGIYLIRSLIIYISCIGVWILGKIRIIRENCKGEN